MAVTTATDGAVRTIRLDVGRLNVLDLDAVRALGSCVREAIDEPAVRAIAILGRDDAFSAGLDVATLAADEVGGLELLAEMGELLVALYGSGTPVVAGCRGHAVAAGAMLLLTANRRVGAEGRYRIGFSELGMGMPLPELPVVLARERLDARRLQDATLLGRLCGPEDAAEAGFLDRVVPASLLEKEVGAEAETLATLPGEAYAETVATVRGPGLRRMEELMDGVRRRLASLRGST